MAEKLVRNRIPLIIGREGKIAVTRVAHESERRQLLKDKLREEVEEFCASESAEEMADIMEVIYSIRQQFSINQLDIDRLQEDKKRLRGTFSDMIILVRVEEIAENK